MGLPCDSVLIGTVNDLGPRGTLLEEPPEQCTDPWSLGYDVYAQWARESGTWKLGDHVLDCWRQTWSAPWTTDYYVFCRSLGEVASNHDYDGERNVHLIGTNFTGDLQLTHQ
jgi:hypothetical protein